MWLFVALMIVLTLFGLTVAQAPDDADPFCTETLPGIGRNILDYPPQVKPLLDSRHYQNLLPPHGNAVWQEVDNDNNNRADTTTDWTQNTNLPCRQTAFVCGFSAGNQDNWMITQHISRVVGVTALPQVTVQVDFQLNSCTDMNNCSPTFAIYKYETSTINATAARNLSNYEFVTPRITPSDGSGSVRENASIEIDFDTAATGLYLGIRDETTCVSVHRVLVFYYVCPAETSDLITRLEVIAPRIGNSAPLLVGGQCVENSSPESGMRARLTCSQNGDWGGIDGAGCVCDAGFQRSLDGRSCVGCDAGMYLSINVTCLPCPANSNSTQLGLSECPCFEGYFRAAGDPPERECTQPPSAPLNLQVLQVTNTTVSLSWNPPMSNGGRDDLEYQLSYQRADVPDSVMVYGRVNVTVGQIMGLRPFTQYMVSVSGENGVSAQVTGASGRTVSATITTEEGLPLAITPETIQVNETSDIITWQPPSEPNGQILHYNIRIYQVDGNGNEVLVEMVRGVQETAFNFSTRGLSAGIYNIQIQAVTSAGVGEFSEPVTLTIEGSMAVPSTISPPTFDISMGSTIITWQPPAEPNGDILHYNVRISRVDAEGNDSSVIIVVEVTGTTYNFTMLGLRQGTYNVQVQAVTRAGSGQFSIPLTLSIVEQDSECPAAAAVIVAAVIPSIVAVIAITVLGAVLCSQIRSRMKPERQNSVIARDHPVYDDVEPNLDGGQTIETKQNVAYETGMQVIAAESNVAYGVVRQGHSPEQHNTSV